MSTIILPVPPAALRNTLLIVAAVGNTLVISIDRIHPLPSNTVQDPVTPTNRKSFPNVVLKNSVTGDAVMPDMDRFNIARSSGPFAVVEFSVNEELNPMLKSAGSAVRRLLSFPTTYINADPEAPPE